MTKQELIQVFKDWCADPENEKRRRYAFEHQHQRYRWVAEPDGYEIMISKHPNIKQLEEKPKCLIQIKNTPIKYSVGIFEISEEEYKELELLYIEEFDK